MKKSTVRNTLAKEIKNVAQRGDLPSTRQAQDLAIFRRALSESEAMFGSYYQIKKIVETNKRAVKIADSVKPGFLKSLHQEQRDALVKVFMDAVDSHDYKKTLEMAEAVGWFKHLKYAGLIQMAADPERAALMQIKVFAAEENNSWTIREVASWVRMLTSGTAGLPEVESAADGFSALRRKCREVGIPLAPAQRKPARPIKAK